MLVTKLKKRPAVMSTLDPERQELPVFVRFGFNGNWIPTLYHKAECRSPDRTIRRFLPPL